MGDSDNEVDNEDVIRVLIATDNHLGYGEKDAVRGEDSFTAFEEILQLAVIENVDFILLGGDLFHDAVPSQNAMNKCMKLLRTYTFGDKPIEIEFLSDQTLNFHSSANKTVNYEDPNLNVSIPVFSIHGNHDDPSGFGRLSALDLLATTGLVNYFGRWTDLNQIEIKPLLLRKGKTQVAIYGLSHIHDNRLARLFENNKVQIERPHEDKDNQWFHMMVLHQNRADRGPRNYLPEDILPEFLHLIIWGHEHDCRLEPELNGKRGFYVSQPGSSVPTSLSEGEHLQKHVGLLQIFKNKFQMKSLPLQTVRPFVFESVNLKELNDCGELRLDEGDASNKVRKMAEELVISMIERAKTMQTGHPKQPILPLIRLRIVFTREEEMFNAIRFGQTFNSQVANPVDMIHFKKVTKRVKKEGVEFDKKILDNAFQKMEIDTGTRVEHLVERYFEEVDESKSLKLISSKVFSEMCYHLVERHDIFAAEVMLKNYKDKAANYLMKHLPNDDDIGSQLIHFKQSFTQEDVVKLVEDGEVTSSDSKVSKKPSTLFTNDLVKSTASTRGKPSAVEMKDDGNTSVTITTRARGRGRGASKKTTNTRSTRSGHTMPELDVSINSSRNTAASQKQASLLDVIGQTSSFRRSTRKAVYVISDNSD